MFTGIIQEVGRIQSITRHGDTARIRIHAPHVSRDAALGDSICSNGVCLTAAAIDNECFEADLSSETMRRSAFASAQAGDAVNLEPSLTPTSRMGGHIVAGHVDGAGSIESLTEEGEFWNLIFRFPPELGRYIAEKGSIAIDGISLTVTFVEESRAGVALVPFTIEHTSLKDKGAGDPVNLEADVIARYVERLISGASQAYGSGLTLDKLRDYGFTHS